MPTTKKPSLALQIQKLTKIAASLETRVTLQSELLEAQQDTTTKIINILKEMLPLLAKPADVWLQRGEESIANDEKEKTLEKFSQRIAEIRSSLLDVILDANLAIGKITKLAANDQTE